MSDNRKRRKVNVQYNPLVHDIVPNTDGNAECWKKFGFLKLKDGEIVDGCVVCQECHFVAVWRKGGPTSTLTRHKCNASEMGSKQTTLSWLATPKKRFNAHESFHFEELLCDFIATNALPLQIIESKSFSDLLEFVSHSSAKNGSIDVSWELKSRTTLRKNMIRKADGEFQKLKSYFESCPPPINFMIDSWDNTFSNTTVLGITHVKDTKAVCVGLAEIPDGSAKSIPCLAHTIELAIKGGLNFSEIVNFSLKLKDNPTDKLLTQDCGNPNGKTKLLFVLKLCAKLCSYFKRAKLNGRLVEMNYIKLKVMSDVRWSSTATMLGSLIRSWDGVKLLLEEKQKLGVFASLFDIRESLKSLCDFLENIKTVQLSMESTKLDKSWRSMVDLNNIYKSLLKPFNDPLVKIAAEGIKGNWNKVTDKLVSDLYAPLCFHPGVKISGKLLINNG